MQRYFDTSNYRFALTLTLRVYCLSIRHKKQVNIVAFLQSQLAFLLTLCVSICVFLYHQSGGSGQFGVCVIDILPLEEGAGVEFESRIKGGVSPSRSSLQLRKVFVSSCRLVAPLQAIPSQIFVSFSLMERCTT